MAGDGVRPARVGPEALHHRERVPGRALRGVGAGQRSHVPGGVVRSGREPVRGGVDVARLAGVVGDVAEHVIRHTLAAVGGREAVDAIVRVALRADGLHVAGGVVGVRTAAKLHGTRGATRQRVSAGSVGAARG